MKTLRDPDFIFFIFISILTIMLCLTDTGFEPAVSNGEYRAKAVVTATDNSDVVQCGIIKTGDQELTLKLLNTRFKGQSVHANNRLIGKLELDKFFAPGDKAFVVLETENDHIRFANVIDHFRINVELALLLIFLLLLVGFAGITGLKAIISFIFTGLMIWKILLPGFLKGHDPILLALLVVAILTGAIIFLVGGLNKKGLVAFAGAMTGILLTCILSIICGDRFRIHGAVKPFSETLLSSGYPHLDLSRIFLAGIFVAASGAVMDIAMDIAASQEEVVKKHPGISFRETILSGFAVGKAVVGTMTTTLLLAYSGSFSALMMVFLAQRVPAANLFNLTYVASEILHTLVGSFGLVAVAPLTAIIGGLIYTRSAESPATQAIRASAERTPSTAELTIPPE